MLEKPAVTAQPIHQLLRDRWSPRAFSDKAVSAETLTSLFEAARWAPSSGNGQPCRFIVVTKENAEAHATAVDQLMGGNQPWAAKAPVIGFVVAKTFVEARGDKPQRKEATAQYSCGLAVSQLTIEAQSRGLVVHQMGGIFRDKIRETYKLPEGYETVAGFTIGYQGEVDELPEAYRERETGERSRLALSEIVFTDTWGEPFDLG